MTSEKIWQRSDMLGTQVITRDTGKRLGVVNQLWVDVDQREVVALGLRENWLSGLVSGVPKYMLLSRMRQIGDVILVDNEDVIEDINPDIFSSLINSEVITETGEPLGRVRDFRFDVETGKVAALVIASLGLPIIPDQIVSTYELPIEEIVSSGPDRLIVFEGAEERLNQLTVGILERLGIGKAPWDQEEVEDYMIPTTSAENQLGSGARVTTSTEIRRNRPLVEETWDEDNWGEPAPKRLRQRQPEPTPYEDVEDDNWSEASGRDRYQTRYSDDYEDDYDADYKPTPIDSYEDIEEDLWADEEEKTYKAPPLKIPEKTKTPEYEEEGY